MGYNDTDQLAGADSSTSPGVFGDYILAHLHVYIYWQVISLKVVQVQRWQHFETLHFQMSDDTFLIAGFFIERTI